MLEAIAASILLFAQGPGDAVSAADRSGPSRRARCRLDGEPERSCRFTPLFGDGSFNIELGPQRQLRLVLDGERAHLFVPITPDQRVRMSGTYRRNERDRACWVSEGEPAPTGAGPPHSICVYR
jgi:hypothetical protein